MRAFDLARAICRVASAEIDDPKLIKLAASIASAKTVAAVVNLCRADRRHAATVEQWNADPWVPTTKEAINDC
jgi:putative DNA primase/helicase